MLKRIVSLLLSTLVWACASASAWAQEKDQLAAEADRAKLLIAAILREHGSDIKGCRKAAQALSQRRFGVYEEGRLQLLAGEDAVAYQQRWQPQSAIEPLAEGCGWTHVAAYFQFKTHYASVRPATRPSAAEQREMRSALAEVPVYPPVEVQLADSSWRLGSWLWLLGALVLVAVAVALAGAARAMAHARRADLAAREVGIPVPVPSTGSSHPVLEELLRERAKLIAELRATGIELNPQTSAPSNA